MQEPGQFQFKVETDESNSVMIMVFESQGKDVVDSLWQDIMRNKNQGSYCKGFSCLETILDAGNYTVVISPEENT